MDLWILFSTHWISEFLDNMYCFSSDPNVVATVTVSTRKTADPDAALITEAELIKPRSNDEYIGKIRKRLQEDASARREREKRRRKVLVDQLKSHEAMEVGTPLFFFLSVTVGRASAR